VANEYADLATLKAHLNIESSDTTRDTLLNQALASASRGIDRDTGRRFFLDAAGVARTFNPSGKTVCDAAGERLLVNDIGSVTGLVVETGSAGSFTAVTDYETAPDNALVDSRPITALLRTSGTWGSGTARVRVTARWGWPSVPDEVVQATLIQAARLYRRKDSPEGVTGSAEWGVVRLSRVDPDVYALIKHFLLPGFG
jgi:hypothetical protein